MVRFELFLNHVFSMYYQYIILNSQCILHVFLNASLNLFVNVSLNDFGLKSIKNHYGTTSSYKLISL